MKVHDVARRYLFWHQIPVLAPIIRKQFATLQRVIGAQASSDSVSADMKTEATCDIGRTLDGGHLLAIAGLGTNKHLRVVTNPAQAIV